MSWFTVERLGPTMLLIGGVGCGRTMNAAALAGKYAATAIRVESADGNDIDVRSLGADIEIGLDPDGRTVGELELPAVAGLSGEGFHASMAGRFAVVGDKVRFEQPADTFIGNLFFTVDGTNLRASYTFRDERARSGSVTVVLTRQS